MKALIKDKTGVSLQKIPFPHSNPMVIVKIKMVGLCRTDLLVAASKIKTEQDSIILGHEFSGIIEQDTTNKFTKGQIVSVNPLYGEKFMGVDFNGAICEYISVPHDKIIVSNLNDFQKVAYLEPVAASMAVLKVIDFECDAKQKVAILGQNRIATLSKLILQTYDFDAPIIEDNELSYVKNEYDMIIETNLSEDNIHHIFQALKPGGTLLLKSRNKHMLSIFPSLMVSKEINIKSVNYFKFESAMGWLEKNHHLIEPLFGETFPMNDWKIAFDKAESGENKKIFIKIN